MKSTMKLIAALLCAAAAVSQSCTATEPVRPATGQNASGTSEKKTLKLSSILDLNAGGEQMNSHAGKTGRSHLSQISSETVHIGSESQVTRCFYPRVRLLPDGRYMLTWQQIASHVAADFSNGRECHYAFSDDMKSWKYAGRLFSVKNVKDYRGKDTERWYTNANVKVLGDGRLMAAASFWVQSSYDNSGVDVNENYTMADGTADQGIAVKFSSDNGKTWTDEKVIYNGPCWEPEIIEARNGQLQVYASESRPKISASHGGVFLNTSDDGGRTWSPGPGHRATRVMRKAYDDAISGGGVSRKWTCAMPIAVLLNGQDRIAYALEMVKGACFGSLRKFYVSIYYSYDNCRLIPLEGSAQGPDDTGKIDPLREGGCSPYMVQFPSGETFVIYGVGDKLMGMTGDENAAEFTGEFTLRQQSGNWASMEVDSPHTVVVADRDISEGLERAVILLQKYYLNHDISASRTPSWSDSDEALFIGSLPQTGVIIRCAADADNVYFKVETSDAALSSSDKIGLLFAEDGTNRLNGTSRRICFNATGLKSTDSFAGSWTPVKSGVKAHVFYDGTIDSNGDTDNGFTGEFTIPRSELPIKDGALLFNAYMFKASASREDAITSTSSNAVSSWIRITLDEK